ncbi:alpha/beta fold hydrolase [Paraburkholderia fungorum]|jgi:pimeloyl-ACP methyl ester carboxylesterase|uniref:Pimeloyl-ACP methyl ester carboxylesterase n=1 Tax=Paraburkholderia fungorum TaxID=134537 RepID=A0AAW3UQS6_9BURK|nr:alpha/beta hydrolase [Paraburkholderia fungorum]MBB4513644.1 pimeloyl-ACP methyl ester carboxylesterase [Paraburkholderia fungorum]MBB6200885.1 pimeloyl-ACP methyl ester carboxylesterase [Paraburkholderia fungorum]
MTAYRQTFVEANGIRLHVAEQGDGPLVLLCHGFPETSHAWRHQLAALAHAGFHAVAPDLRGYGSSERPTAIGQYTTLDVVGDLVALVDTLGERHAVVVGNDWGATIAWQAALLRPDRFRAVVALGVPMMGRAPVTPSRLFPQTEQMRFYTHYFSEPGLAETELERDVATTLRKIYYSASGDVGTRDANTPNPFGFVPRNGGLLDALIDPPSLPAWLAPTDLDKFVQAFSISGFRGGLNYYRNLDRNWEVQSAFEGLLVEVPALYLVGERDTGLAMPGMHEIIDGMSQIVPRLSASRIVPRAGHWLQQEAPDFVNAALIEFLRDL